MGLIILGIILFIALFILVLFGYDWDFWEGFFPALMVGSAGGFFIPLIIGLIMWNNEPQLTQIHKIEDVPILSLTTNSNNSGTFFLGCGSVKGEAYYYYYAGKSEGFQLTSIGATKAIIVECDTIKPCIRTITYKRDEGFRRFMLGKYAISCQQRIIIPKGSIITTYNPNL